MLINKVEIFGYGKLSHQVFEFNQFQAILGANEAGKTTMINFIKDMLFGFTKRKTTHPYAPKDKTEMGGRLFITTSETNYIIERVEGKNGGNLKITDNHELELPPESLKKLLGPINRDTFDNLFYFGSPNLTEVGKLSKDELETRIRQVGVIGIEQWLSLKKSIEKEADELYKQRGKKPLLNQALLEYQKNKQKLNEAQQSYAEYLNLNHQYQDLIQEQQKNKAHQRLTFEQLRAVQADEQNWNNYNELENNKNVQIELLSGYTPTDLSEFNELVNEINFLKTKIKNLQLLIDKQLDYSQEAPYDHKLYLANQKKFDDLYLQLDTQINNERNYENATRDFRRQAQDLELDNEAAGGNDSLEFTPDDKEKINRLLEERQTLKTKKTFSNSVTSEDQSNSPWKLLIGIGLGLIILGFVVGGVGLFALLVVGLGLLGLGGYLKTHTKTNSHQAQTIDYDDEIEQIDQQLSKMAKIYQIENQHPETWTTILQDAIKKRNQHRQQLEILKQELHNDHEKLVNYLNRWNLPGLNQQDFNQSLNQINQFMINNQELQNKIKQQQAKRIEKLNEISDYQKQIEKIELQQQQFLSKRNVASFAEFKQQYQIQQAGQKRKEKIENLENSLSSQMIDRLKQYQSYDDLKGRLNELKKLDQENSEHLTNLSEKISSLKIKLNNLAKDGTYDELRQEIATQRAEINDLVSKWLTLKLTDEWIEKVLNLASHGRFPQVQKLAQKYFNTLTNQHYVSVEYGKKIRVKTNDGVKFEVKELSKGTMQQLYLALIFALTMSFSDEYPMPIIIDDGFVDFDHVRTDAAIDLMKEISENTQVIYFTADDRIEKKVKSDDLLKLI
ncbi:AAA family ATPase [Fructilactobacillus frigidiflavus]|uniref:AAA family ATPase n=1 Tax=Fructilactobacillus frigidiflavus TaxID=3242688 RepID=UPI003756DAF7